MIDGILRIGRSCRSLRRWLIAGSLEENTTLRNVAFEGQVIVPISVKVMLRRQLAHRLRPPDIDAHKCQINAALLLESKP